MLTIDDVERAKRREDLVPGYSAWIRAYVETQDAPDCASVNQAIMNRWSVSALTYIKRLAWNAVFRPQRKSREDPS